MDSRAVVMKNHKPIKSVVTLSLESTTRIDRMISKLQEGSSFIRIDRSKLVNTLVTDFPEILFEKSRERITENFLDPKRDITAKLHGLDQVQLKALSKYLLKVEKE